MNNKLTGPGLIFLTGLLFFALTTGVFWTILQICLGLFFIKLMIGPGTKPLYNKDKEKHKPIPPALADKLARRNIE